MTNITPGLRLAFAGTPGLAATILDALIQEHRHIIDRVYTQPDRPAGRGKQIRQSPVFTLAKANNIPVEQPAGKADIDPEGKLKAVDVLIVAAYGMLLPQPVLDRPRFGCINVHTSLLPRWRGAAPIQHCLLAGDTVTGITIIQMDAGLDTGDILLQRTCPVLEDDNAGTLHDRLAALGSVCILEALDMLRSGNLRPRPQTGKESYAGKIHKNDAMIDWSRPASEIACQVRAFNPAPVAHGVINNRPLRIWKACVIKTGAIHAGGTPGTIKHYAPEGLDVCTGNGVLRILQMQQPGKKVLSCRDFYNGNPQFGS